MIKEIKTLYRGWRGCLIINILKYFQVKYTTCTDLMLSFEVFAFPLIIRRH